MGKKDDVNTGHDGLINGILGAPLMGMIGGIPGMIAGLFLGATFDEIDRRKAAATYNPTPPGAYIEARNREFERKKEEDINATAELEELMKDAKIIYGTGTGDRYQIEATHDNFPAVGYCKDGKIQMFNDRKSYVFVIKEWPAELYYRPYDFLKRLKKDKIEHSDLYTYRIERPSFKGGSYMYTVNNGKSYVACARDYRLELKQRKEAEKIDQLI